MKKFLVAILALSLSTTASQAKVKNYETGKLNDFKREIFSQTSQNTSVNVFADTNKYSNQTFAGGLNVQDNPSTQTETTYHFNISVQDIDYITSYKPTFPWSPKPHFVTGDPLQVRFNDDRSKIFIRTPNGKEIKTKVVQARRMNPQANQQQYDPNKTIPADVYRKPAGEGYSHRIY